MYKCEFCNKEFETSSSLAGHIKSCKLKHQSSKNKKTYTIICKNCGKQFELNLTEYIYSIGKYRKYCCRSCANKRIHSDETKAKISKSIKVLVDNNPRQFKHYKSYICKNCGKTFNIIDNRDVSGRTYCSKACKDQWLNNNWKQKVGGYRKGSGHGKSGWYKGIYCDSSWELAFVIYHLEHNLNISRCREKRTYVFEGKTRYYYPDFVTDDGIIEIKGYKTEQWKSKITQNNDIMVLYKSDMSKYLDYVISKYGENFIYLYESK